MSFRIVVRVATEGDNATIAHHQDLAVAEAARYRGQPATPHEATHAYVAVVGETVLGSLSLSIEQAGRATISHVFVEEDAREIGLGDSLLSFAMRDLLSHNITYLAASAQPGDRSLKNLYERHGLVAQTILVGRSLSDLSTEGHASQ